MDVSMDDSNSGDETQATQLLQHVLEPRDSSYPGYSQGQSGNRTTDYRSSISGDSLPRQYDYHGLASTQTQTQLDISAELVDGDTEGPAHTPISPKQSPLQPRRGAKKLPLDLDEKHKAKAVSFQSPSPKKFTKGATQSSPRHPPTRSTTFPAARGPASRLPAREPSEDSFAGDIPLDPAQQFLASSKRFDIPLSELKRLADTNDKAAPSSMHSPMRRRVPPKQLQRFPTPEGKILVESTPSLSGGSQFSEDEGPTEEPHTVPVSPEHGANLSRQPTEEYLSGSEGPSSSYLANLENRANDFLPGASQMEPTQPSTQIATQMETQEDSGSNTTDNLASVPDSTTSSKKRAPVSNLLKLVSPSKRHRYEHYVHTHTTTRATAGSVPSNALTQEESFDHLSMATQPSEEVRTPPKLGPGRSSLEILSLVSEQHSKSYTEPAQEATQLVNEEDVPPPPRRYFPTRSSVHTSQQSAPLHQQISQDEIPDSEPTREAEAVHHKEPPVSHTRTRPPVSARPSKRSISADDIVPDSMDMDVDKEPTAAEVAENPLTPTEEAMSSDDESEVPLAKNIASKGTTKSKEKAPKPAASRKSSREVTKAVDSKKSKAAPASRKRKSNGALPSSWEDGMVPSSVQNEEPAKSLDGRSSRASSKAPAPKSNKGKGKAPATSRAKTRRAKRGNKSGTAGSDEDEESSAHESEDEKRTVSDKASTHGGEDESQTTQPPRKRKRTNSSKAVPTPVTRQTRRMNTVLTGSIAGSKDATRIFGFWKPDGYWYPGSVVSHEGGNRYKILFDDHAEGVLTLDQLRTYTLEVGDVVVAPRYRAPTKVIDVTKFKSGVISVEAEKPGSPPDEVSVRDLKIHKAVVQNSWGNRMIAVESIRPVHGRRTLSSTPSRSSIANLAVDASRGKWLEHTAVVITAAPTATNNNNRESILEVIKRYGGTVLEDWSGVLHMAGKHDSTGHRWTIRRNDVHWIGKPNIERVFLLGDQPTAKAKYLLALAIGIPCVSSSWLQDKEDDLITRWPAHLLPQGECAQLGACLSQQVNLFWGTEKHDVTQMMETSTAFKLFDKSSVLCIGPEVFPQRISPNARLNDMQKQAAFNAVTQIILAMGADYVEAIPDVKYASRSPAHYDYVVIKKPEEYDSAYRGTTVVLWQWVKDCLIASRKLPLRNWDLEEDEYSQEI